MQATKLIDVLAVKKVVGNVEHIEIQHLSEDSREVKAQTMFFCIDGSEVDGHAYAAQAKEKGAVLFVASKDISHLVGECPVVYVREVKRAQALMTNLFYDYPSAKMNMIGVTGTNGKTTIAHLIESIYRQAGFKTGMIGTINRRIGDQVYSTKNTTPSNIVMQDTLHQMVEEEVDMCVCEVSSHALYQGRVWGVDFNTAIFTNLTHEHLETHKTMEEYGFVKSLLFSGMGNNLKPPYHRFAIVNADDPYSETLKTRTGVELVTFSVKESSADFYAKDITYAGFHTQFTLVFQGQEYPVEMDLIGEYNVSNALAAIAAAYLNGIEMDLIQIALKHFEGIEGRMQLLPNHLGIHALIDYAHTPDGLIQLLDILKRMTYKRMIIVMGHAGGNRDNSMRPELGRLVLDAADYVVFTTDNPRTEDPYHMLEQLLADSNGQTHYEFEPDRKKAIERGVALAEEGDLLAFIGKGHEKYQIIGHTTYPHDEAKYASDALAEKYKNR